MNNTQVLTILACFSSSSALSFSNLCLSYNIIVGKYSVKVVNLTCTRVPFLCLHPATLGTLCSVQQSWTLELSCLAAERERERERVLRNVTTPYNVTKVQRNYSWAHTSSCISLSSCTLCSSTAVIRVVIKASRFVSPENNNYHNGTKMNKLLSYKPESPPLPLHNEN